MRDDDFDILLPITPAQVPTVLEMFGIGPPPPEAYTKGTRVMKAMDEPGDKHAVGDFGTVVAWIGKRQVGPAYFVEWDDMPGAAVLVVAKKITAAT